MMGKIGGICYAYQKVGTVHKLYLYDEVKAKGDFNWETYKYDDAETSAKHFQEILEQVGDGDTIELYINSDGGSVKEGTAIFTQLKRCKAYKTGYVDGVANSIAATILQACDHRVMGEGTGMILHNMWTVAVGSADDLRNEADKLDAWMKASRALFVQRCEGKVTEEKIKEVRTTVASLRLDAVASSGFSVSRTKLVSAVNAGLLQVNWQPAKGPSQEVKEGDIISMRGRGRMKVEAITGTSRKGRIGVYLKRFM